MLGWSLLVVLLGLVLLWLQTTQPLMMGRSDSIDALVDPGRLEQQVRLLSQAFFPRDAAHPEILSRVADYLETEFNSAGAKVKRQSYTVEGNVYHNVIASYGPETEERVIVGAHYNTAGPQPGADDNASGVAPRVTYNEYAPLGTP